MNVLIYELQNKLQDLVTKLQDIQGISIYFAFNDHEFREVTTNIHLDIIFANDDVRHSELISSIHGVDAINIFFIDESQNKMKIMENTTHKTMSLQKIFN